MATWHLHLMLEKIRGGQSKLADLDMSLPVSIRRCWPSFVSQVVIGFGGCLLSFVGDCLHFLAGCGDGVFVGCRWLQVSCCGCRWWCCWVVLMVG